MNSQFQDFMFNFVLPLVVFLVALILVLGKDFGNDKKRG